MKFNKIVEKSSSNEICNEEQKIWNKKLFQLKKDETSIPLESFVSYQEFFKKNQDTLINNKYNFDVKIEGMEYYKKITSMKEEELTDNFNNVINLN